MRVSFCIKGLYDTVPGQRFTPTVELLLRDRGAEVTSPLWIKHSSAHLQTRTYEAEDKSDDARALARRAKLLHSVEDYDAVFLFAKPPTGSPVFRRMIHRSVHGLRFRRRDLRTARGEPAREVCIKRQQTATLPPRRACNAPGSSIWRSTRAGITIA